MSVANITGVEGEERSDFTKAESRQIRDRSLRLLNSLLRPLWARVTLTIIVVVISTAAQVAVPANGSDTAAFEQSDPIGEHDR